MTAVCWTRLAVAAALAGALGVAAGCTQAGVTASAPPAEEAPLLLDEDAGDHSEAQAGADNSRCRVCHLDLAREELAVAHARADMGCAGCHGESDAHIADESWSWGGEGTAPERMFPRPTIIEFCLGCHSRDKLSGGDHPDDPDRKVCTDCHGAHRMPVRRCKWR